MASRRLEDLRPEAAERVKTWLAACAARGVDVLVYCTLRSPEEQAELYALGRTKPGKVVTNAPPWASYHQFGMAADGVPLRGGKPLWTYNSEAKEWVVFAQEADNAGLEWAGRWKRFREYVHVQYTGGKELSQLRVEAGVA